ncbi:MAG: bifunctional pyr operon transcriptional regulator/uracil phosphoribosyltransferase, partial [Clostridium sp.]|nr:bifunctional pyr operon transcriptional regulator/uracil phosphoribosyltransferase [Clostridium sp.]
MEYKASLMDEKAIERALVRISHEIVEKNKGVKDLVLVGIKRRGVPLAHRIKENILSFEGVDLPVSSVD